MLDLTFSFRGPLADFEIHPLPVCSQKPIKLSASCEVGGGAGRGVEKAPNKGRRKKVTKPCGGRDGMRALSPPLLSYAMG